MIDDLGRWIGPREHRREVARDHVRRADSDAGLVDRVGAHPAEVVVLVNLHEPPVVAARQDVERLAVMRLIHELAVIGGLTPQLSDARGDDGEGRPHHRRPSARDLVGDASGDRHERI